MCYRKSITTNIRTTTTATTTKWIATIAIAILILVPLQFYIFIAVIVFSKLKSSSTLKNKILTTHHDYSRYTVTSICYFLELIICFSFCFHLLFCHSIVSSRNATVTSSSEKKEGPWRWYTWVRDYFFLIHCWWWFRRRWISSCSI